MIMKKENGISKRQEELLYIIVQDYIANANPVGSKLIINKYMKNLSAATIRNDMAALEKAGLITKVHNSSGRVPSIDGYKYYEQSHQNNLHTDQDLEKKLRRIFLDRALSIDDVISKSVTLISESFKLPSVVTSIEEDVLIKRIDLVETSKNTALIIVITSDGNVSKNIVQFDKERQLKDTAVCVRIFNDRLVDTKVSELDERINLIKDLIKDKVDEYEFVLEEIINRIFRSSKKKTIKNNVKGQSNLLVQPEFQEQEKLRQILKLLEDSTVWEVIALKQHDSGGKTSITFGDEINQENNKISIVTTEINTGKNSSSCISLVGPTRMDYTNVKSILDFIKNELEKNWKE